MAATFKLSTGVAYVRGFTGTVTAGTVQFADGSASAPSISFASNPDRGLYNDTLNSGISFSVGGTQRGLINGNGWYFNGNVNLSSANSLNWSSGGFLQASDLQLWRDTANTLAQRSGTNAQAFRVYNTYTDASNYSRLNVVFDGQGAHLFNNHAGTGPATNLVVNSDNTLYLGAGGTTNTQWQINTSGNLIASTDNTYDIGAAGANRPRNIYVGGFFWTPSNVYLGVSGSNAMGFIGSGGSDGVIRMANAAGSGFSRLILGTNDATVNGVAIGKTVNGDVQFLAGDATAGRGAYGSFFSIVNGTNATAGLFRSPNAPSGGIITARNAANTADATLLTLDTHDIATHSGPTVTLADGAITFLGTAPSGFLFVNSTAIVCQFTLSGSVNIAYKNLDSNSECSVTKGNAGTTNVYYDAAGASGAGYYLENKQGSSRDMHFILIGG